MKNNKMCPVGTSVQTIIFSKDNFTEKSAKHWAEHNDFKFGKTDIKENTIRIRQNSPFEYKRDSFRTIELTDGVKAVIGCHNIDNQKSIKKPKFVSGGNVKFYTKENEHRLGRPSGSIEKEILEKVKDRISSESFVGSFGWKTPQGKLGDGYLYRLDEFDQNLIKDLKLKQEERVFRYVNRTTAIGGMMLFIKINIDKGLLYFLVESDNDDIVFETKGVKALWVNLIEDKFKMGGSFKYGNKKVRYKGFEIIQHDGHCEIKGYSMHSGTFFQSGDIETIEQAKEVINLALDENNIEKVKEVFPNAKDIHKRIVYFSDNRHNKNLRQYKDGGLIVSADWGNDGSTPSNNKDYIALYAMFPDNHKEAKAIWNQLSEQQKEGFLYDLRVTDASSEHLEESWLEFVNAKSEKDWLKNATNWDEMKDGGGVGESEWIILVIKDGDESKFENSKLYLENDRIKTFSTKEEADEYGKGFGFEKDFWAYQVISMEEIRNRGYKIENNEFSKMKNGGGIDEHKYELGDKYRGDFDYDGMLEMGLKSDVSWGYDKLKKLHNSFEDVNYATASKPLWDALKYLKEGKTELAEDKINEFHKIIKDILEDNDDESEEKDKLSNMAYQLQNTDEGWINNNPNEFIRMQNEYKEQFRKVYGHSNYKDPLDIINGGEAGSLNFREEDKIIELWEGNDLTKGDDVDDAILLAKDLYPEIEEFKIIELFNVWIKDIEFKNREMKDGGGIGEETWVISYLNKKNNFQKTDKEFKGKDAYEQAVKWGKKNLENYNSDMIRKKFDTGGGVEFIEYKGHEIMFEPTNKEYFVNDEEFKSLEEAKEYIDNGAKPSEKTINAYKHGAMKDGGGVGELENITNEYSIQELKYILYLYKSDSYFLKKHIAGYFMGTKYDFYHIIDVFINNTENNNPIIAIQGDSFYDKDNNKYTVDNVMFNYPQKTNEYYYLLEKNGSSQWYSLNRIKSNFIKSNKIKNDSNFMTDFSSYESDTKTTKEGAIIFIEDNIDLINILRLENTSYLREKIYDNELSFNNEIGFVDKNGNKATFGLVKSKIIKNLPNFSINNLTSFIHNMGYKAWYNDISGLIHISKNKMKDGGGVGEDKLKIANEIVKQLGGMSRLNVMTGAYNFVALPNGLSFKIKNAKANYIKITLTSMDLYDLEVGRIRGGTYKVVEKKEGLYNDMLKPAIEKATGMYLSLADGGDIEKKSIGGVLLGTAVLAGAYVGLKKLGEPDKKESDYSSMEKGRDNYMEKLQKEYENALKNWKKYPSKVRFYDDGKDIKSRVWEMYESNKWVGISKEQFDSYNMLGYERKKKSEAGKFVYYKPSKPENPNDEMKDGGSVTMSVPEFENKMKSLLKQENKWHFVGDIVDGKKVKMKFFVGKKEIDFQIFTIDDKPTRMPSNYSGKRATLSMVMDNFKNESAPVVSTDSVKENISASDRFGSIVDYKGKKIYHFTVSFGYPIINAIRDLFLKLNGKVDKKIWDDTLLVQKDTNPTFYKILNKEWNDFVGTMEIKVEDGYYINPFLITDTVEEEKPEKEYSGHFKYYKQTWVDGKGYVNIPFESKKYNTIAKDSYEAKNNILQQFKNDEDYKNDSEITRYRDDSSIIVGDSILDESVDKGLPVHIPTREETIEAIDGMRVMLDIEPDNIEYKNGIRNLKNYLDTLPKESFADLNNPQNIDGFIYKPTGDLLRHNIYQGFNVNYDDGKITSIELWGQENSGMRDMYKMKTWNSDVIGDVYNGDEQVTVLEKFGDGAEVLVGGKADYLSLVDIAEMHKVSLDHILRQATIGMKIEREHSNDTNKIVEIVKDHLVESPDYYTKLQAIESSFETGGGVGGYYLDVPTEYQPMFNIKNLMKIGVVTSEQQIDGKSYRYTYVNERDLDTAIAILNIVKNPNYQVNMPQNLNQLKNYIQVGKLLRVSYNKNRPDWVGKTKTVSTIQTNGFYMIDGATLPSDLVGIKQSWLEYPKSSLLSFSPFGFTIYAPDMRDKTKQIKFLQYEYVVGEQEEIAKNTAESDTLLYNNSVKMLEFVNKVYDLSDKVSFDRGGNLTPEMFSNKLDYNFDKESVSCFITAKNTGRMLVLRRAGNDYNGDWSLMSGGVEVNETPEETIKREIQEELGINLNYDSLIYVNSTKHPDRTHHYYELTVNEEFEPVLNEENDAYMWINMSELPDNTHPLLKKYINSDVLV